MSKTISVDVDLEQLANDALIEVLLDTIPDMSTDELARLEIAVNGELQDRSRSSTSYRCNCIGCQMQRDREDGLA